MITQVPVLDLGGCADRPSEAAVAAVARAAEQFGFFQVVNHGIDDVLIDAMWHAARSFFAQPIAEKRTILRTKQNSRGYYDRELTKNARDQKEVLDISFGSSSQRIDGVNQWPEPDGFRPAVTRYLDACNDVALWLLQAFCLGLGEHAEHLQAAFGEGHTSFVRMNHYPVDDVLSASEAVDVTDLGDMALHHHSDAGALTLLLQDDVGGLQVEHGDDWIDVEPLPGALVVNTGDMMQVWSNDRYHAALHRVRPMRGVARYSLPYFFNPTYETDYAPLPGSIQAGDRAKYRAINWGDFRQARADGDFADYGTEVQIDQFRTG